MKKTEKKIPPGKLYQKALTLARATTLENLYDRTGLPLSWLRKFRQGEIPAPSVQRVEAVIVGLTGKTVIK